MIRRVAGLSLAAAGALLLAGCGGESSKPAASEAAKPEATASAPAPAPAPSAPTPKPEAKPAAASDAITTTVVKTEDVAGMDKDVSSQMPKITDGTAPGSGPTFLGTWAVTDSDENIFDILVFAGGKALTNYWGDDNGPKGETGTYEINGDKCKVTYSDGWVDVLSMENGALIKYGYAPGSPAEGAPTNQSQARSVGVPMLPFVGVWRANLGDTFGTVFIALKSDGTAMTSEMGNATGTWSVDDNENVAMVEIGNGGPYYTLQPDGTGHKLSAWESGAPRTGNATVIAPATMPGAPAGSPITPQADAAEGTAN